MTISRLDHSISEFSRLQVLQVLQGYITNPTGKFTLDPFKKMKVEVERIRRILKGHSVGRKKAKQNVVLEKFGIGPVAPDQYEASPYKEFRDNLESVTALWHAKVTFQQMMGLKPELRNKILKNGVFVATLLGLGVTWDKVCLSRYLDTYLEHDRVVCLLFQMGATLKEIEQLPLELLSFLKNNEFHLGELVQAGVSIEFVKKNDFAPLRLLVSHTYAFKELIKFDFDIKYIATLKPERLKIIDDHTFSLRELRDVGLSRDELQKITTPRLKKTLQLSHQISQLVKARISLKELLNLSDEEFEKVTQRAFEIERRVKAGATLAQALANLN